MRPTSAFLRSVPVSLGLLVLGGCGDSPATSSTADFELTGRAAVSGVVMDSLRQALDSFEVSVDVASSAALYRVQRATTGGDGRFAVEVEQRGGAAPGDSARATVTATSLRARDRSANGTPLVVREMIWLRLAKPPVAPIPQALTLLAPTRR